MPKTEWVVSETRGRKWRVRSCLTAFFLGLMAPAAFPAWEYHGYGSDKEPLCQGMRAHLNKITKANLFKYINNSCAAAGAATYPGFRDPPWEEVDAEQHKELLIELMKYQHLGSEIYFGRTNVYRGGGPMSEIQRQRWEQGIRQEIEGFLSMGGHLRVWRTRLINDFYNNVDFRAPPGPQTVLLLQWPSEMRSDNVVACPAMAKVPISRTSLFIVKDDLSGPDPRVGHASSAIEGWLPMLYEGKTFFIGGGVTLGHDIGFGPFTFCELQYKNINSRSK